MRIQVVMVIVFLVVGIAACAGCGGGGEDFTPAPAAQQAEIDTIELASSAFTGGEPIPKKYSRDGGNISPPLEWEQPPESTRSFVIIFDDPDAPGGTWTHWVVFNIPADTNSLPEGIDSATELPPGTLQGKNSWGNFGYDGPDPPGGTHHYRFRLYAVDKALDLEEGASRGDLLEAIDGNVLAAGELVGTYSAD